MEAERRGRRFGFPYLFFSFRCGLLLVTILSLIAWFVTGFDIEEGAVPLVAIQWSTVATFSFWFYLGVMSFQIGGIQSFAQLEKEFVYDFLFLGKALKSRHARRYYFRESAVPAPLAILLALLIPLSALFVFEDIWVPLYDYFQFGHLLWPVYYATIGFSNVLALPFVRNMVLGVLPIALALLIFSVMRDYGFSVKLRLDEVALILLGFAIYSWGAWVLFPATPFPVSQLAASAIQGPLANTFNASSCYIFPSQQFFPQNTYTFYPCSLFLQHYAPKQILGFFSPNDSVHAINVFVKFITFGAIVWPMLALVKKTK